MEAILKEARDCLLRQHGHYDCEEVDAMIAKIEQFLKDASTSSQEASS